MKKKKDKSLTFIKKWENKDVYTMGDCLIFIEKENHNLIHMSISCKNRRPTYDEIKKVRYELIDKDKIMAMIFPSEKDFVNIHNYCFHLFELQNNELQSFRTFMV